MCYITLDTLQSSHPTFLQCCYSNHLKGSSLQWNVKYQSFQTPDLLIIEDCLTTAAATTLAPDGNVAFVLLHQCRGDASNSVCTASQSFSGGLVLNLIKYSLNNPTFCLHTCAVTSCLLWRSCSRHRRSSKTGFDWKCFCCSCKYKL